MGDDQPAVGGQLALVAVGAGLGLGAGGLVVPQCPADAAAGVGRLDPLQKCVRRLRLQRDGFDLPLSLDLQLAIHGQGDLVAKAVARLDLVGEIDLGERGTAGGQRRRAGLPSGGVGESCRTLV